MHPSRARRGKRPYEDLSQVIQSPESILASRIRHDVSIRGELNCWRMELWILIADTKQVLVALAEPQKASCGKDKAAIVKSVSLQKPSSLQNHLAPELLKENWLSLKSTVIIAMISLLNIYIKITSTSQVNQAWKADQYYCRWRAKSEKELLVAEPQNVPHSLSPSHYPPSQLPSRFFVFVFLCPVNVSAQGPSPVSPALVIDLLSYIGS